MKQSLTAKKWIRVLIPSLLITIWLLVAGIGGPYFGKIGDVASNDQSTFLPASAESTAVSKELEKFQNSSTIPAIIVFSSNTTELTAPQISDIQTAIAPLSKISGADTVSPVILADDKKAALVVVNMKSDADYKAFTAEVRTKLDDAKIPVQFNISGPVGFLHDLGKAFSGIDGILLIVALSVVFIILIIVYRSPVAFILLARFSMRSASHNFLIKRGHGSSPSFYGGWPRTRLVQYKILSPTAKARLPLSPPRLVRALLCG